MARENVSMDSMGESQGGDIEDRNASNSALNNGDPARGSGLSKYLAKNKWWVIGFAVLLVVGAVIGAAVGISKSNIGKSTDTNTTNVPTSALPEWATPISWGTIQDYTLDEYTIYPRTEDTFESCRDSCGAGCQFFTYTASTKACNLK